MSKFLGLSHFVDREFVNARLNEFKFLISDDGSFEVMPRYFKRKFSKPRYLDVNEFKLKFKNTKAAKDYFNAVRINTNSFIYKKLYSKQL